MIELSIVSNKLRQGQRCQVADSDLIWSSVLDNFRAEIARLDSAEIFLVRLPVGGILVQNIRRAGLNL